MKKQALNAQARSERGTAAARRLRRDGNIPAVIYGHSEPTSVAINARDWHKAFKVVSENTLITLSVGDTSYDVLVKDYQEDLRTGTIHHIDFYEIERGKALHTHVPVHLVGQAAGVREGGILEHSLHDLEIECLPKDIPESFEVAIAHLQSGQSIHVSDIQAPEGVRILNSADQVVAAVTTVKAEAAASEDGEGAEEEEAKE